MWKERKSEKKKNIKLYIDDDIDDDDDGDGEDDGDKEDDYCCARFI